MVEVLSKQIFRSIVDEGASISILSSTAWEAVGSPSLISIDSQISAFNRRPSQPLGILPKLPILLGGKTVCIDVMVVQGPLDFNLLLGQDYVYAMKAVVSSLFRVMHFPHNGNIVTIDQFSFITPNSCPTFQHTNSLGFPVVMVASPPQQVNHVFTC